MHSNETIAAVATAPGEAGIAIIRISGPDAKGVAAKVAGRGVAEASAGSFFHSRFSDPRDGRAIDDGMVLFFGAPRSYTGEDVVELQGHGGRMQSSRLLDAVLAAGARLAGPGEFTRRAFLNGKVDLTQAEAVADLIAARTERGARVARAQLDGALGRRLEALYDCVADICADMEAWLDLEEGEIGDSAIESATSRIEALAAGIDSALATAHEGRLVREGALAVISGAPNVGKSSLLNALLGTERAIVSPVPGTTRDTVEECVAIDGIPLRIADTAGLRDAPCEIEREGVARARTLIARADIHLRILDASGAPLSVQLAGAAGELPAESTIIVANKCDIAPDGCDFEALRGWNSCRVSAKTGAGLDDLRRAISAALGIPSLSGGDADMAVAARHREELMEARAHAEAALARAADGPEGVVLAANELRGAAEALGRITGRVFTDELLDRIFCRFCVGK